MKEEVVSFGNAGGMTGIITDASPMGRARAHHVSGDAVSSGAAPAVRPTFLFMNGSGAHHGGPNNLHVKLARVLAQKGFSSIRFDSSLSADADQLVGGALQAMEALARTRGVSAFVPIGMGPGAIHAFTVAQSDSRVSGAVLINGQMHLHGRDQELGRRLQARAMARHAWRIALKSSFCADNWKKAITGQLARGRVFSRMLGGPVRGLADRFRLGGGLFAAESAAADEASDPLTVLAGLSDRGVLLYHLFCEGDEGLDYFHAALGPGVQRAAEGQRSRLEVIPGANHGFTLLWSQEELARRVCAWAEALFAVPRTATVGA